MLREALVCSVPTGKIDSLIGKPMNDLKLRYFRYSCRAIFFFFFGGGGGGGGRTSYDLEKFPEVELYS